MREQLGPIPAASWWFAGIIVLLLTITGWAAEPQGSRLIIRDFSQGRIIAALAVKPGETFVIRYIHSVDKKPIFERFRLDPDIGLVLEKTWFTMFGAGLGHWEGHGHLTQSGGWITIDNIEYPVGNFILRIGSPGVDHTIIYREKEINLSALAPGCRAIVEFKQ
ncbi:MAG: DUF1850 domain-containing protein [Deltaproteobacteria bacterium]|nr:DUF1850 domain-containing protein [Candidatus Anaeroferrophillus wilburensis]MBN2890207.1 DUF1850 domain-containing protein [Deltaproteobacteria bacterium]